ncbi:MAG: 3'-5' exoribonuclease YhaM family protein [Thermodesulfobacteriota bacterium]
MTEEQQGAERKGKIFIKELQRGQNIESFFHVREKNLSRTKSGTPYLSLRLADRTGEIEGRVWDNAPDFAAIFDMHDFIKVRAEVEEFQGNLQLRITKLRRCLAEEIQLDDYLPRTSADVEKMFAELKSLAHLVKQPFLAKLLDSFLADQDFGQKFKKAPAAKNVHHVYLGGLLEHTLAVTQLILLVAPRYPGVNQDLLLTGGILHDIGKIEELFFSQVFDYTDAGRLIGHIVLTVEMVDQKIKAIPDFPEDLALLLKHMLISHHGDFAFGSPKLPMTMEALILHHLDDLDAKVNAFWTWIEKEKDQPARWTSYHKPLARYILKPEDTENTSVEEN